MVLPGGIALVCDARGGILEVLRDDLAITGAPRARTGFTTLGGPETASKARAFLDAVEAERTAFDWELTMPVAGQPMALHFDGGVTTEGNVLIVGAATRGGIDLVYDDMLRIGHQEAGLVRALLTAHVGASRDRVERDSAQYDELTRLNNDLATAHRELARTTAELSRLNTEKNQFLGMAAHDLRNPLGVIVTVSEMLLDEAAADLRADHLEMVEMIHGQGRFMLRLVNDLLDVSKIEAGRLELERAPIDLAGLVRHDLKLIGSLATRKGIAIRFSTSEEPLIAPVDAGKMEQVVTNLLTNAIKFSSAGTSIDVRLSRQDDEVLLSVGDQGPGIPASELPTLFRPFQRTTVKASGGEQSTGLGLVIVRKIVEGHGGRISVESTVGMGSTFIVALPGVAPAVDASVAVKP